MKQRVGIRALPKRWNDSTIPSFPQIPTSALAPLDIVPTIDAIPPVRKWANFGVSSGSYITSRAGRATLLMRDSRAARYFGESDANSRLEDSSGSLVSLLWMLMESGE